MRRFLTVGFSFVVLTALVVATPAVARAKRSLSLPFHTRVTLSGRTLGSHPAST